MSKKPITPGSRVKIISGKHRGQEHTVARVRDQCYVLRDCFGTSTSKGTYLVKVHSSNCQVLYRNSKERNS